MVKQWHTKKWVVVSLHVLFWALFFVTPYLLRPVSDQNATPGRYRNTTGFFWLFFSNNILRLLLFYANAYLFIPKLFYRKKYIKYLLTLAGVLGIMLLCDRVAFDLLIVGREHKIWNFFAFNLFPFLFIVITSLAYRIIKDKIEENQRMKERETENLKTELSFLRSQVSPHFMFNLLNNMVALARKGSEQLEPSLIKLSSLLRYMLYETDEEKVPLQKEIEYLQSYVDLQQQRFGSKVVINACFGAVEGNYEIAPMLLIPFVENAFKHGTGRIRNAQIDIHLTAKEGRLDFSVRNRYNEASGEEKDKASGIGLNNVTRRLELLYGNQHNIQINKNGEWFTVSLKLMLN